MQQQIASCVALFSGLAGLQSPPPQALTPSPTPTPGPLDIIKAFKAASNRGDTDAVLDLFVEEGWSYHVWGGHATDKHSLRYHLDFLARHANPQR
jgi:hypothetical protein